MSEEIKTLNEKNLMEVWVKVAELVKLITGDVDIKKDGTLQSQIESMRESSINIDSAIEKLQDKILSFEETKADIVDSGLGIALGLSTDDTWEDIVTILKAIVNNGAINKSITTSGGSVTIPEGYHNGSGKITGPILSNLIGTNVTLASAANLLSGVTAYGKDGIKYTGSMTNRGAVSGSISSSGGSYTIPAGYHNGSGKVTGPTLSNLIGTNVTLASAANLLSGVTAYGKNGNKYTGTAKSYNEGYSDGYDVGYNKGHDVGQSSVSASLTKVVSGSLDNASSATLSPIPANTGTEYLLLLTGHRNGCTAAQARHTITATNASVTTTELFSNGGTSGYKGTCTTYSLIKKTDSSLVSDITVKYGGSTPNTEYVIYGIN